MKIEEMMFIREKNQEPLKEDDQITVLRCLACFKPVISKVEYEKVDVICPYCNKKFNVRHYKNGSARILAR